MRESIREGGESVPVAASMIINNVYSCAIYGGLMDRMVVRTRLV